MPNEVSTRDISKLVTYYVKNIRPHAKPEMLGIFRQIQLLTKKGITLSQISRALQNYAADDWVKSCDPRVRHHIRKFMTEEKIAHWQTPIKKPTTLEAPLATLDRMAELQLQPKPPTKPVEFIEDDDTEVADL